MAEDGLPPPAPGGSPPPGNRPNWPPRQHAYRPPPSGGPSGRPGQENWTAATPPGQPPFGQVPYGEAPPPPPAARPATRRPPGRQKSLIWGIAIVAVVVILLRIHRISQTEVIWFCVLIPSLIFHEVAHGWVALAFGDDTAKRAGRLSLNPIRHVDPVGTLLVPAIMVLSGWGFFGWAKPVPVTVGRLRSPRNQGVLVSLAGPFTNIVLAALAGLLFHIVYVNGATYGRTSINLALRIIFFVGVVNLWVAFFNLIPIPPLDGSAVLERFLPGSLWVPYLRVRSYGLLVIFGGLLLLGMAHVYPLNPVFDHLENWWVTVVS